MILIFYSFNYRIYKGTILNHRDNILVLPGKNAKVLLKLGFHKDNALDTCSQPTYKRTRLQFYVTFRPPTSHNKVFKLTEARVL